MAKARPNNFVCASLAGLKLGLVINFGERIVTAGIRRVVNGLPENLRI